MREYSWSVNNAGDELHLVLNGGVVARITRWTDGEDDVGIFGAETVDEKNIVFGVRFLEAVSAVQARFQTDVAPPADLMAEWGSTRVPASTKPDVIRQPFNGRCSECGHVWTVAYAPMPLADFAQVLMAARCPMCAAPARKIKVCEAV